MRPSPVLLGAGAGLVLVLALAPATGTALGELAAARSVHARLAADAGAPERPATIVSPGVAIAAADAAAARAAILARVQRLAKAGGVLVEETEAVGAPAGLALLRLRVSGSEKAVLALADALERERPLMRLRSWQLAPIAGGVRLTGEVVAPWQ